MTGRLLVTEDARQVALEKKHYPLLTFSWCVLVMGVVVVGFYYAAGLSWFFFMGLAISVLMIALFTGVAVYADRKPAIIIYDKREERVYSPRYEAIHFPKEEVQFLLIPSLVTRNKESTYSQLLGLEVKGEEILVHLERSRSLK